MSLQGAAFALVLRYYGRELWRRRRLSAPALFLPGVGAILQRYAAPLLVAGLVGRVARTGSAGAGVLVWYVLGFGGLLVVAEVLWRIGFHCLHRVEANSMDSLYRLAMDELLAKDVAFFHDNFAGSLTKRAVSFAARFEQFVDTLVFEIIAAVLPLLFAAVVLWHYDPRLVAVLFGLIMVAAAVVIPLVRRRRALVDEREAAAAALAGHVADSLANMQLVRAFAAEPEEAAEHRLRVADHRRKSVRSWDYTNLRIDTAVVPLVVAANMLGLAVALDGHAKVQIIMVTFTYYWNSTTVMFRFNQIYRQVETALTEAAQFTVLLLTPSTVLDPADPEPLRPRDAEIRFEKVDFAHEGGAPLFRGLELTVPSGAKVGLVGRSGGGKSTLTQLLLRLMDTDGGRILIGGQDISRVRQSELRRMMAYVPQDPAMFHRMLAENIRFARPDATDDEVRRAAVAAHVTEFADRMPAGMDTLIGERGVKLSGGQRQRVALARAILRDAPILLLDEATSALDSESETLVQQSLWEMMDGRTALVVAHRLSTVAGMDRLIVLDRGRIVEEGSHRELLRAGGAYARLWRHQSGGFLGEPIATG